MDLAYQLPNDREKLGPMFGHLKLTLSSLGGADRGQLGQLGKHPELRPALSPALL